VPRPVSSVPPESLSGLIERVTFHNEDTGFAVLRVKARGHRDLLTVVGSLASVSPGEWINAQGRWVHDREFGPQFRAEILTSTPPTTREGIEKYLGSGMVRGIGPIYARKLVEQFGDSIFTVIERESARLEQVDGIGPKRRRKIKDAWNEQKAVREIMLFLHSHGVSTARAVRIFKTYGEHAIETVRANPYALARDIPGIGFKTADQIAQKVGIPFDSLARACAGLRHVLLEATADGHCALPMELTKDAAAKLLLVSDSIITEALNRTLADGDLVTDSVAGEPFVFLPSLKRAEEGIASTVARLARTPAGYPPIDLAKAITWVQERIGKQLAPSQKLALQQALTHRILIITGGPGVGKTTLLNAILRVLRAKKMKCLLCAPTGRAARRLAEATGCEAKTIHRLLEVEPGTGRFARNEERPLDCDLLVTDECSMVDVTLMRHLLRALPDRAHLLLVGDMDQLPSVGPGMVLHHLIQSGVVPVVRLTEVFRQAAHSQIITNAHRILQGLLPDAPPGSGPTKASDFHFIERAEPEEMIRTLLALVKTRIPARFGLDPLDGIQVLCPMNRGSLGVRELNLRLQNELNPPRPGEPEVDKFGWQFRRGDKVLQTVNNYDKDVFNGDIGKITRIDPVEREVIIRYDQREVSYDYGELDEIALAYATTIHKAQGSEFPAVVIPMAMQQYLLLQRNLLYTGITRGRNLVIVVGQRKAMACAVRNSRTQERYSGLLQRILSATGHALSAANAPSLRSPASGL
jgi:exodeoxyribonuclease V alpha subunit